MRICGVRPPPLEPICGVRPPELEPICCGVRPLELEPPPGVAPGQWPRYDVVYCGVESGLIAGVAYGFAGVAKG